MKKQIESVHTLVSIRTDSVLRDNLWTEWRVLNQGTPYIDNLDAEPPSLDDEDWIQCIDWHNEYAYYSGMNHDDLVEALIMFRLEQFTGDGLDRDIAMGGQTISFRVIDEMSDAEIIKELMGIPKLEEGE